MTRRSALKFLVQKQGGQCFIHSNSQVNGHTYHGVVTCGIVLSHRVYSVSFCWIVVRKWCVHVNLTRKIAPPYTALFLHLVAKVVAQKNPPKIRIAEFRGTILDISYK